MKIFVIGFNKTGTTSLHALFTEHNIKSIHSVQSVMPIIDKYDAFCDGYHYNFEEYYNKYPNDSVFILNTRPIFKWLVSRYKHAKYMNFKTSWCWPICDKKTNQWITDRENHFKNVLDFFADKSKQLLVVNIEKNGWENIVINFLINNKNNIIRKKNILCKKNVINDKDTTQIEDIKDNISKCLKERNYTGSEVLFNHEICIDNYTTFL